MDFKYFCWLIIVFLLPKQWSIVGLPTTINYGQEIWNVLAKVSTNMPNDFIRIRDFLFNMHSEIKMCEGQLKGKNETICGLNNRIEELINETKALDKELVELKKVVPALRLRDYIENIYYQMFPEWLKDSTLHRYYKWVIAIKVVNHAYFDDLRADMRKNNITADSVAKRVCQIYEKTSPVFIHRLPVKRPSEEEMIQFCSSFIADDKVTLFTCKQLVATVPELNDVPVRKEEAIKTKFNIIITNIEKSSQKSDLLHSIEDVIQKVPDFSKHECKIVQSVAIPSNYIKNAIIEGRFDLHLDAQYYRVGTEINLITGTTTEVKNSYNDYTKLKNAVRDEITNLLKKDYKKISEKMKVLILDDDMRLPSENDGDGRSGAGDDGKSAGDDEK